MRPLRQIGLGKQVLGTDLELSMISFAKSPEVTTMSSKVPCIAEWLSGKNLLITGGTGYIGKILLEKLLRSCPEIGNIYLLLRPKKGKSVEERLQDIISSDLWTYQKVNYDFTKLIPVKADLDVTGMDISEEDTKILQHNVHIVFHIAASVKFTDPLDKAIRANVRLTLDMVNLSKTFKHLELFTHVSTAYSNCDRFDIEEKMYPSHMDWQKAIKLADKVDPYEMMSLSDAVLGRFPNTYTLTKNMAEHVVWDHRSEIPILIFRPVIVSSLIREPVPGWSDNLSGVEVIYYALGKGLIRIVCESFNEEYNFAPGDVTINCLITSAWKRACHAKITNQPAKEIVQSNHCAVKSEFAFQVGKEVVAEEPVPDIIWREYFFPVENPTFFLILHLLFNAIPALLLELLAKSVGVKIPALTKPIRMLYVMSAILYPYFMQNNFNVSRENMKEAVEALSEDDKITFATDVFTNGQTFRDMVKNNLERLGALFNERKLPLTQRLQHRRRMILLDQLCRIILAISVLYYFPYHLIKNIL